MGCDSGLLHLDRKQMLWLPVAAPPAFDARLPAAALAAVAAMAAPRVFMAGLPAPALAGVEVEVHARGSS